MFQVFKSFQALRYYKWLTALTIIIINCARREYSDIRRVVHWRIKRRIFEKYPWDFLIMNYPICAIVKVHC